MAISGNAGLHEQVKIVHGLTIGNITSATPDYVCLKGYSKCAIVLKVLNGTTVTGSAITIKQASAVAGTGEKAVTFTKMWANIDCAATDVLVGTTVASNTFTTDATNSKILMYVMEVGVDDLDLANGFDCIRLGTANAVAILAADVTYYLYPAGYGMADNIVPTAITDPAV